MAGLIQGATRLTFDAFEVDPASGEIFKKGFRVRIQSQPFKILCILLEKPGQVVSREELQLRVWGPDTVVDFDHSIAAAINKLRESLGDSADHPRFVETLARRGYRFIAPVNSTSEDEVEVPPSVQADVLPIPLDVLPAESAPVPISEPPTRGVFPDSVFAAGFAALLFLVIGLIAGAFMARPKVWTVPPHITAVTTNGSLSLPSLFQSEEFAPIVSDGVRLFASSRRGGRREVIAIPLTGGGGTEIALPNEVASARIADLSPDGTRLLLRSSLSRDSEQPLWIASTMGGSARRIGSVLAQDATWMPDGASILYAAGNELYTLRLGDNTSVLYAKLPGRAFWMRWSPDRKVLRFTIVDPLTHIGSLWELAAGSQRPKPLLPNWHSQSTECCGVWMANGKSFIFESTQEGSANLWRLDGSSDSPQQLTDGPLQYMSPVAARAGDSIYFLGKNTQTTNSRYDAKTHSFVRGDELLRDALRVAYSRDGQWVAWTTGDGSVWRCRIDGSEQLQLTPPGMTAFSTSWSPDGKTLAMMARKPGEAWHIYLLPANGGQPQLLLNDNRNAADPTWSPDGRSLAFGRTDDAMGKETSARTVSILNLATGSVETLPNSDGLFSPRWSPDGRYIAALSLDGREARVYDVLERHWSNLPVESAADPVWSQDSKSLWIQQFADPASSVVRISFPAMQRSEVVELVHGPSDNSVLAVYLSGITPGGDLLTRVQTSTGNLYSLRLEP